MAIGPGELPQELEDLEDVHRTVISPDDYDTPWTFSIDDLIDDKMHDLADEAIERILDLDEE